MTLTDFEIKHKYICVWTYINIYMNTNNNNNKKTNQKQAPKFLEYYL